MRVTSFHSTFSKTLLVLGRGAEQGKECSMAA